MNIIPQAPNLSIPTVLNPHTESLRRENHQREIITQPAALNQSAAEKGVSSDKERGRTPAQNSQHIDFASLKEKAELANNTISERKGDQQGDERKNSHQHSAINEHPDDKANESSDKEIREADVQTERIISELQHRDREVRSHELAHAAVGGSFTGPPSYTFETGPDGKKYAVEGEVSVDLSPVPGNPSATIAKMKKVHAAALAPANPSTQDIKVAASAIQMILQAQSEMQLQDVSTVKPDSGDDTSLAVDSEQVDSKSGDELNFDEFMEKTLTAQENIAPTQSNDVLQRAVRVETFYSNITQAYEKQAIHHFELTA